MIGDSESAHIVLFVRFLCLGEHGGKSHHEAAAVALRAKTKNFRGAGVSLRIRVLLSCFVPFCVHYSIV